MSDPIAATNARLVWFFGPSCAGKATLIREVAVDLDHPLSTHLLLESPVEICAASLEVEGRPFLGQTIRDQLRPGFTLLVKGQSSDIKTPQRQVPRQLAVELPGSRHDVVVVWADPTELDRRALLRAEERPAERDYWLRHHGNSALELTWQIGWTTALGMSTTWVRTGNGRVWIGEGPVDPTVR